jgi:hypothetical protein
MMAPVGSEGSFEQGRQQLEQLAGVEVTTKAVERQAEAIGEDIARREQAHLEEAIQLGLPQIQKPRVPFMYVEMDGTGVPVVAAETKGVRETPKASRRTRVRSSWDAFSHKPRPIQKAGQSATTTPPPTPERSRLQNNSDDAFIERPGIEAGKPHRPESF